jgi:uncharacterized delta-60 repeat protein
LTAATVALLLLAPAAAHASVGNFAMAVQPDGRIVAAGGAGEVGPSPDREYAAVVRYLPDGSFDPSFGKGDGVVLLPKQNPFTAVALQENGRILLASPGGAGGVTRLLANGNLDRTFGSGGYLYAGASTSWHPTSIAVAKSGTLFTAGMTGYPGDPSEAWYGWLYRITANGRTGEVTGGMTDGESANPKTFINDFVFAPDGSVIAAGTVAERRLEAKSRVALAHLTQFPVGGGLVTKPEQSFGAGAGLVQSSFHPDSPFSEAANALAWSKGRLLVTGTANDDLLLARYSAEGILQPGFGRGGFVTTSVGRGTDTADDLAVARDGRIYVAGSRERGCDGCTSFLLARYGKRGQLQRGFGKGGIVSPAVDTRRYGKDASESAYAVKALAGGEVLVGGLLTTGGSPRFFLRRYLVGGAPDRSFGAGGRVATLPLAAEQAR